MSKNFFALIGRKKFWVKNFFGSKYFQSQKYVSVILFQVNDFSESFLEPKFRKKNFEIFSSLVAKTVR